MSETGKPKKKKLIKDQNSETFNRFEQARIGRMISKVVNILPSKSWKPKVLDVGAGMTGNLSLKFLDRGCEVIAADISADCLKSLNFLAKNDRDLIEVIVTSRNLPFLDERFDIVAAYSVLHHIPDYLHTVKEMVRVVRKGGLIFIDHEAKRDRYFPEGYLREYYHLSAKTVETRRPSVNRKSNEIHVHPDDHIEWDKIKDIVKNFGCEVIYEKDYLLYQPKLGLERYNEFKERCSDMKTVIIRK